LEGIITGALSKITEAGAVLAGGHTIEDDEPKFGLSVTGLVHPEAYWANAGAQPGDGLVLTKPIGSGVLFNANLKGLVSAQALDSCVEILTTLNKVAAETFEQFDVHAATDVTGFGLAGHGLEMARGSNVTLRIAVADLPVMQEALTAYGNGITTGVNASVWQLVDAHIAFERELSHAEREILVDPQTSGGLLVAVPGEQVEAALAALHAAGIGAACQIGVVEAKAERPYLVVH
jgi:selenide,water dikinase